MNQSWTSKLDLGLLAEVINDGHSIFNPTIITEIGLPPKHFGKMNRTYKSDFINYKTTIYVNNKPVKSLDGIKGNQIRYKLFKLLDIEYSGHTYFGRGSQARAEAEVILDYIKSLN